MFPSWRLPPVGLNRALKSQSDAAAAQELEAKTMLLQSQLDYVEASDELIEAIGQTPE